MTEDLGKNIISNLGVGQIFEGVGNIINIIEKVIEEGEGGQVLRSPKGEGGSEGVGG